MSADTTATTTTTTKNQEPNAKPPFSSSPHIHYTHTSRGRASPPCPHQVNLGLERLSPDLCAHLLHLQVPWTSWLPQWVMSLFTKCVSGFVVRREPPPAVCASRRSPPPSPSYRCTGSWVCLFGSVRACAFTRARTGRVFVFVSQPSFLVLATRLCHPASRSLSTRNLTQHAQCGVVNAHGAHMT